MNASPPVKKTMLLKLPDDVDRWIRKNAKKELKKLNAFMEGLCREKMLLK
jgi:hypothetical protein